MASLMSIRRRLRLERGAELIEMALVLPLLMLIIMGIIDFGFLFREMSVVTNAAREGARAGVLPDYSADANVSNRVQQYLNASGISVTCPSADCVVSSPTIAITPTGYPSYNARDVRVTIFHQFSFLGPIAALVGGSYSSVALTGRAVMRVE
jgi:Flp pilus assembly protein TadG